MKEIENYKPDKYDSNNYIVIEDEIYKMKDDEILFVTSISFVQEPEFDEGENASYVSQFPLEDILDKFYCHISDFYEQRNTVTSEKCFLEFASPDVEDIRKLRSILGKHVYNKEIDGYVKLIIE